MTLQKAIEILIDLLGEGPQFPPDDRREAVNLGIEALKGIQYNRDVRHNQNWNKLPSETQE